MSRRTDERESAAPCGFDRRSGCKQRRLVRRLRRDRVSVEPRRAGDFAHPLQVLRGVAPEDVLLGRRAPFAPERERRKQLAQPLGPLWMVSGRVELGERRVAQDVDARTASASSVMLVPFARAIPTR